MAHIFSSHGYTDLHNSAVFGSTTPSSTRGGGPLVIGTALMVKCVAAYGRRPLLRPFLKLSSATPTCVCTGGLLHSPLVITPLPPASCYGGSSEHEFLRFFSQRRTPPLHQEEGSSTRLPVNGTAFFQHMQTLAPEKPCHRLMLLLFRLRHQMLHRNKRFLFVTLGRVPCLWSQVWNTAHGAVAASLCGTR